MQNIKKIRARSGYTLVEMLVVIAILGVVFSVAIPSFLQGLRSTNLKKNVAEVVTLFETAREQALSSEMDQDGKISPGGYGVFYDRENQAATLFIDDWNDAEGKQVNINYGDEDIANRVVPDGKFSEGDTVVSEVNVNLPEYVLITDLFGVAAADGSDWEDGDAVTVIFIPPHAETSVVGKKGAAEVDLKEFESTIQLGTDTEAGYNIFLNRVTTTPQITKIKK